MERPNVNIGDVFYIIKPEGRVSYSAECPVCKGTRKLNVNGYEFACPECNKQRETVCVYGFCVKRYRVYSVKESMPHDSWKPSDIRTTEYELYHRHGHGNYSSNHYTASFKEWYFKYHLNCTEKIKRNNTEEFLFSDYDLAVEVANRLNEESVEVIKTFNEKHGTDYPLPEFNIVHDKKSK